MSRPHLCTMLLSLVCLMTATGQVPAEPPGKLAEGWRREVKVSDEGDVVIAWVENGWLQVQRRNAAGDLDWHIVLAEATDPQPPTIDTWNLAGSVKIAYQNGRYFVREYDFYLRAFREKKDPAADDWPRLPVLTDDYKLSGYAGVPGHWITNWRGKSWFVVTLGPAKEASDCLVRLNHLQLGAGGGVQGGDFLRSFSGEGELLDDGDLLICKRVTESAARSEILAREIKAKLKGSTAPDIDGATWLNTSTPLSWKGLRGKVVLLDFWGTWCKPCVEKLPRVEALYQKYKDRGLVVIGVHSKNGAESVEAFLKDKQIHFPVVVDAGQTAQRYAVESWPTYFLIDPDGHVVWGFQGDAPDEKQIEELLPER